MIDYAAMEAVLLASWHRFLDGKRLMAAVLSEARNLPLHIVHADGDGKRNNGPRLTLVRFEPAPGGFLIWADFQVPREGGTAHGIAELFADLDGQVRFVGLA